MDMLKNKRLVILIAGLLIILILILLLRIITGGKGTDKTSPSPFGPTPLPSILQSVEPSVFDPSRIYEQGSLEKDYQRITSKRELSENDKRIRLQLIALAGNKSGVIHRTENYILEYVSAPNQFMAEITNPDINSVKTQINQWLFGKGLTQDGVCKLPLVLYLNSDVRNELASKNLIVSLIPEGCD